jgi:ABC-type transport system involved in cytochrome c biogenesis permease subunit
MSAFFERITVFCFAASYGVALALEIWHQWRPRPVLRIIGIGFGAAGLLAHTLYIWAQPLSLALPLGSLLFLAWILAIFYLYGSIHHYKQAWGLFVLPLVIGLILLGVSLPGEGSSEPALWSNFTGERFWGWVHGMLLLMAGVGVSVAFVASIMYLVQMRRLQAKRAPGQGMRMMSLERLESMNRKAILWAFPLLTLGLIVGIALQLHQGNLLNGWESPKILSTIGLWLVFAILIYVRYGAHARGRQVALLSLLAFAIMICALLAPVHPFAPGGGGP